MFLFRRFVIILRGCIQCNMVGGGKSKNAVDTDWKTGSKSSPNSITHVRR